MTQSLTPQGQDQYETADWAAGPLALFPGRPATAPRTLVDVLDATVRTHPHEPALDDGRATLSYRALAGEVEGLRRRLAAAGVGVGDRVGVRAPSGTNDLYVCILAVLAAGAAYVPVDAEDPDERAALVFGEAQVSAVLGADRALTVTGAATPATPAASAPTGRPLRLVAVTSCPTGIAHTYMAAQALEQAAARAGAEIQVETQGSAGSTPLAPSVIAAADAVILAHDVEVRDKARFAGKPTVDVGVKAGVNRADELIAQATRAARAAGAAGGSPAGDGPAADEPAPRKEHWANRLRQYLMTGVSYMIPFVAAGGLLIALGFAIGGYRISSAPSVVGHFDWTSQHSWAAMLFQAGAVAFGFLVPILSGYIAYAIADRPALTPGIVGGAISVVVGAGFLGGLVSGLLSGFLVLWMVRWRVPKAIAGIMPVVVIPLISVAVIGFLMFVVVGSPIASAMSGLTNWLNSLSGTNAVLLGVLLGAMMAFDMGGPLNKVAYTFAAGALTTAGATPDAGSLKVMAAVMAAGMTPPLGMALATTVRGRLFTRDERENGKAAWVLGASFITEGAIPFAAADPLRVIPAAMVGSMTTGGLVMAFGSTLRAPHGGIWVLPLIGNPVLYVIAIAAGTVITAVLVTVLKGLRKPVVTVAADRTDAVPAGV